VADDRIGRLFPSGGPVPPDLVIGRDGEIEEVTRRLREAIHTLLSGGRRIGKTTVCDAACDRLKRDGAVVVKVEVPESSDAGAMLQLVVDRCSRISLAAAGRRILRAAQPVIEKVLREEGIPLDLSELGREPEELPTRSILALPRTLADQTGESVVFFLDELQRAADYAYHEQVLGDLVDLYSGASDVVVLVDGSEERTLEGLIGTPVQMGKLCDRLPLEPRIPTYIWRDALPERFGQAGLAIEPEVLEKLVAFGEGRPYDTMTAARYAALNARKLGSDAVGMFEVEEGIAEARRHLDEDA
jgi:AAA ATPase-like protein